MAGQGEGMEGWITMEHKKLGGVMYTFITSIAVVISRCIHVKTRKILHQYVHFIVHQSYLSKIKCNISVLKQ